MKILRYSDLNFSESISALQRRATTNPAIEATVQDIIKQVAQEGDQALIALNKKFGGCDLTPETLAVTPQEITTALNSLSPKVMKALLSARRNVSAFAKRSLRKSWFRKNAEGAVTGERFDPFQRVGIYIPGGTAPLVSSAIMTATLAQTANVSQIVATTPAGPDGLVNPALLAALSLCGATEIYKVGGAQAIAAMALGTQTIRPVQKVFGPGSVWVVEAKRQLFGQVAVDLLPGPSEVLVIADETANPAWIAADLLAQSEHGHGSVAILLTSSEKILTKVQKELEEQLPTLPRKEALAESLANAQLILVKSLEQAVTLANQFAPEHVSIATKEPGNVSASLQTSGAIFLGGISPVAAGDFLAGPSHTLPTGGAGKSFSGLTVDQFQRRTSILFYDETSLQKSLPIIDAFSEIEGLAAHGRSVSIRLPKT